MPIPGDELKAGWGVLRLEPWHLAGIFASSIDAESLAMELGSAYAVIYGEHIQASQEFIFKNSPSS
jgi:hypothetical protein